MSGRLRFPTPDSQGKFGDGDTGDAFWHQGYGGSLADTSHARVGQLLAFGHCDPRNLAAARKSSSDVAAQPAFGCTPMERHSIQSVKYAQTIVYSPLAMMGPISHRARPPNCSNGVRQLCAKTPCAAAHFASPHKM